MLNNWGSALADGLISSPRSSGVDNQFGYDGYVFHAETLQYHPRNRTYDARLGRFIQRDMAGYVDGMNLYEYVGGRPILLSDPSGLGITGQNHHWITRPIRDIKFIDSRVTKLFKQVVNAPWHKGGARAHYLYTRAVNSSWSKFLFNRGIINPQAIPYQDALKFVESVKTSSAPEIEAFLSRIGVRAKGSFVRYGGGLQPGTSAAAGFLYGANAAIVVYIAGKAVQAMLPLLEKGNACCGCIMDEDNPISGKGTFAIDGHNVDFWKSDTIRCARGGSYQQLYAGFRASGGFLGLGKPKPFKWYKCNG